MLTFAGMALGDGWGWLREVECDERKATGKAFVGIGAPKKNQSAGRADGRRQAEAVYVRADVCSIVSSPLPGLIRVI